MRSRPSHKDSLLKTTRSVLLSYGGDLLHKDFLFGGSFYMQILYLGDSITKGFPNKTIRKVLISYGGPLHKDSLCEESITE